MSTNGSISRDEGDKATVNGKKKVVVRGSAKTGEKISVVELNKVRQELNKRIEHIEEKTKQMNLDAIKKYQDMEAGPSGELTPKKKEIQDNEETFPVAPTQKNAQENAGAVAESNSDDASKLIRQMAEVTFRQSLAKQGYQVGKNSFLAEGGYGAVYLVKDKVGNRYACKVVSNMLFNMKTDRGPLNSVKIRTRFSNEVDIMTRISSHPCIINFVESFNEDVVKSLALGDEGDDDEVEESVDESQTVTEGNSDTLVFKNFYLIMEYANSKTLSYYVKSRRSLSEASVKSIYRGLADAVRFIHDQHITHRDIKLSNLLLLNNPLDSPKTTGTGRRPGNTFHYRVKLCDFGLSSIVPGDSGSGETSPEKLTSDGRLFLKPVGTSFYMSPEILRSYYFYQRKKVDSIKPYCAFLGDVWALGVCAFYCLHGYYPLDILCKGNKKDRMNELEKLFTLSDTLAGKTLDEIYIYRFRGILRNYANKLSFNGQELLRRMLEVDPAKRANIAEIAQHAYFK